ncbi:MAG: caspase family protein [Burkholderiaceae bacterium]
MNAAREGSVVTRLILAVFCISIVATAAAQPEDKPGGILKIEMGAHAAPVRRIAVDEERGLVVTASEDKSARLWSLKSGELLHIFRPKIGAERLGILYGVAIHPTKAIVAIGGSTGGDNAKHEIHFFNYVSRQHIRSIDALGGDIKNLAWDSQGQYLFASYAGDNMLRAFDWSGALAFERKFSAAVYALEAAANGTVAAASLNGSVVVLKASYDGISERLHFSVGGKKPVSVSVSKDGRLLAVGYFSRMTPPEIFSLSSGDLVKRLTMPGISDGALERVEWANEGNTLLVGGRGYQGRSDQIPVFWIDPEANKVIDQVIVASDSVTELKAIGTDQAVFASFDGGWGSVARGGLEHRVSSPIPDLRGAENLLVSADAKTVSWQSNQSNSQWSFDFAQRVLSKKAPSGLLSPKVKLGLFDNPQWKNTRQVKVSGQELALEPDEFSRSLTYLRNKSGDAIVGTSRRLIRVAANGELVWSIATAGEVRAVNVSADDKLVVTAMSDGSLRWWRTSDGLALLSLLGLSNDRWIAWTASGFYDASVGADQYAGWVVNRTDESTADFYSLKQLRNRFNRPAVIDEVFRSMNEPQAIALVNARENSGSKVRLADEKADSSSQVGASVSVSKILPIGFPPVFDVTPESLRVTPHGKLEIPYRVRPNGEKITVTARVNGRPARGLSDEASHSGNRKTITGVVSIDLPSTDASVLLIAKNSFGVSAPRQYDFYAASLEKPLAPVAETEQSATFIEKEARPASLKETSLATESTRRMAERLLLPVAEPRVETAPLTVVSLPDANSALSVAALPPVAAVSQFSAPPEKHATMHILAIGVSDYAVPAYRLEFAAKDALDLGRALDRQATKQFDQVVLRTLVDKRATRSSIVQALQAFKEQVGPDDTGVLFLAGHGVNSRQGKYYFLPHDANVEDLANTGVPEDSLRSALSGVRGKALMLVDTCYGGAALSRAGSVELATIANDLSSPENGVVVFAGSSGRQLSEENAAWSNGAFTKGLLAGINGDADPYSTGNITVLGLIHYVSQYVTRLTEGRQTPVAILPTGVPDYSIALL